MNEPNVGNIGQRMTRQLHPLSSDVVYIDVMFHTRNNTSCHEQAGPSGEEEEDSPEEQAVGEEREERKRYQLRERRPIQPNLYQPSFGGQASRQDLFDSRHHLAELLAECCLAVLSGKLLVVQTGITHDLVVTCDHALENGHPLNILRFSVYHDLDISPVKSGSMNQAQYIMLNVCNIPSSRHHSQRMSVWYTGCLVPFLTLIYQVSYYIPDFGAGGTGWCGVTQ